MMDRATAPLLTHERQDMKRPPIILLFGMPRSGTTWIGKIFDSHPDTLYRHEPDSWGRLNAIPLMAPVEQDTEYAPSIRDFCARLPGMQLTKVAASTPIFPKNYHSPLRHQLFRLNVVASKAAARLFGEQAVHSLIRAEDAGRRSEEHTSELQSPKDLVCRL